MSVLYYSILLITVKYNTVHPNAGTTVGTCVTTPILDLSQTTINMNYSTAVVTVVLTLTVVIVLLTLTVLYIDYI